MEIGTWSRCIYLPPWPSGTHGCLFVRFCSRSTTFMAGGSVSSMVMWALSRRTSCIQPTSSELQQVPRLHSHHQHYGPLLRPNTHKRSPWYSSWLPLRYFQSLTCRLWHLLAARSTTHGNLNTAMGKWARINMCNKSLIMASVALFKKMIP